MNSTPTRAEKVESGERYRVTGSQKSFTVVDVDDVVAKVQYESGEAEDYRLSSNGRFIASGITKLPGDGPMVADACSADAHEFPPSSNHTGVYQTVCRRCNLSVITLIDHAGQLVDKSLPWQCPGCNTIFTDLNRSGGFNNEGDRICSSCSSRSGSDSES